MALWSAALFFILAPQDVDVIVLEVQGSVEARVPGGKWAKVAKGDALKRGTMVQTGLRSSALLQFSGQTRALVRASTFAVINESFLKKNELKGELRVDVGSVHVEAQPKPDEKIDFKVTTPQGTAAVRGTAFTLRTSDVGLEAVGESGVVAVDTIFGDDYKVGVHLRRLLATTARDLERLARSARLARMAWDNLERLEPYEENRMWDGRAHWPASEYDTQRIRFHPKRICPPRFALTGFGSAHDFGCGPAHWKMNWDDNFDFWFAVKGASPLAGVTPVGPDYVFTLHGRPAFILREIVTGTIYGLRRPGGNDFFVWFGGPDIWLKQ